MNNSRTALLALVALLGICTHLTTAQEWSRFRGPGGAGQSDDATIPSEWTEQDYLWNVAIPGLGHSSPVLWGDKLFITSADPATGGQHILCLNAEDGETRWAKSFSSETYEIHERNSFASGTPAVDADRLYVIWGTPTKITLTAMDHDGGELWQVDLGPYDSDWGISASPILYEDLVIVAVQQFGKSFVVALDRQSGDERWRADRPSRDSDYSTPSIYQPSDGPAQLICNSGAAGIASIDPTDGTLNWEIDVFEMRSVSSPIAVGDVIFGSCGSGGGGNYVVAVRPGSDGRAPEEAYRVTTAAPYVPTPVAAGDLVFLWSDGGVVTCIDAPTGEVHWRQRVGGNYSGSPIRVGKRIFAISDAGDVIVLAADAEYKQLARNPLGAPSRATPAVAGGRMFLRTYSSLICVAGT